MTKRPKKTTGPKRRPAHTLKSHAVLVKFDEAELARLQARAGSKPLAAYIREQVASL